MGMFNEVAASVEAKNLEKVIEAAIPESENIRYFVLKHIVPLYKNAKSEAWESPNLDILKKLWNEEQG